MQNEKCKMKNGRASYWQFFRLIFVIFSLYLMGDAFFRWDGFRFYASFSEFLPNVALVTILWSIVAVFTALLVWLPGRAVKWFILRIRCKINTKSLLLFIYAFIFLAITAWVVRRLIWPFEQTTLQLKFAILLCVILSAILLTWLFRNKFENWTEIIQQRITPLVWLFGIWTLLSFPMVAYHTWVKETDKVALQSISKSSIVDKSRPNIILVTFDALTSRDMSVYGYERPTTPFITKWAKTASLFTRLEAGSNWTSSTTAGLMTGKRVWTHQTYHISGSQPVKSNIENLPLLLMKNGYYTMAFIQNIHASVERLGISNSFYIAPSPGEFIMPYSFLGVIDVTLYQLFGDKIKLYNWLVKEDFVLYRALLIISRNFFLMTETPAKKVFNKFLTVIDNNPPEPFFAWIHLHPPHYPYLPPAPFMGTFDSSSGLRTHKDQIKVWVASRGGAFEQEERASIDIMRARYDEFIKYCDSQFKDFITQLTIRNKLNNTAIILSSDHGESFEHNYREHSDSHLYEQVTHIPLIIKEPAQTEGRIINDLVEQIDIPPTILDLANIPVPSWMERSSLVPLMRGKGLQAEPAFSMAFPKNRGRGHQITKGTIAVWEGDYKLIHYLEENKSLLFNLKEDPEELNNLFDREPEAGRYLLALIKENLKRANERIKRGE